MKICEEHKTPETLVEIYPDIYTYKCKSCWYADWCSKHEQKKVIPFNITTIEGSPYTARVSGYKQCTKCTYENEYGVELQ